MPCPVPANGWVRQGHRPRIGARVYPHTNHWQRSDQVRRSDLPSLDPTFKRSSPRKFARAVLSLNFARDRALRTPHHLHPSDHTFIPNPSTTHLNSISPPHIHHNVFLPRRRPQDGLHGRPVLREGRPPGLPGCSAPEVHPRLLW